MTGRSPWPDAPGPLRPGLAGALVDRILVRPRELRWDWLREGGKEAVPFVPGGTGGDIDGRRVDEAGAGTEAPGEGPVGDLLAERLVSASLRLGADHLLACRTRPEYRHEPVAVLPAHPDAVSRQVGRFGRSDVVVVPPALAAALLVTTAGFGVVAGPAAFVASVLGTDVDEARRRFGEAAWRRRATDPTLLDTAYLFGCAVSGPHYEPLWRAWSVPAEVPPDSAIGRQLALLRRLASGDLTASRFSADWLAARRQEIAAGEHAVGALAATLRRVRDAVDAFVPHPALRQEDDLDEAGLVDAVRAALAAQADSHADQRPHGEPGR